MNSKNRDILHKYWFEGIEVMFDKELDMFLVAMYFKTEHGMNQSNITYDYWSSQT